jgi:NADPH:quinone reductase-like Zn-dependent oxidoreductase
MLANPFRGKKHLPLMAFPRRADLEFLAAMAVEDTLRPTVAKTYPLAEFRAAFADMEKGGTVGKVVVTI